MTETTSGTDGFYRISKPVRFQPGVHSFRRARSDILISAVNTQSDPSSSTVKIIGTISCALVAVPESTGKNRRHTPQPSREGNYKPIPPFQPVPAPGTNGNKCHFASPIRSQEKSGNQMQVSSMFLHRPRSSSDEHETQSTDVKRGQRGVFRNIERQE